MRDSTTHDGPLASLRVIELGGRVATAYATKLLVDLGAEVVLVEPPGGDPLRQLGPAPLPNTRFAADADSYRPDARGGGFFQYLASGKRSVVCDLGDSDGRRSAEALIATADLVFEGLGPGKLEELGIVNLAETASATNGPSVVRISPWGQTGSYRDREMTSLVLQAAGGWAARIGEPDGRPFCIGGRIEEFAAGAYAAAAALTAWFQTRATGIPTVVDLSMMECMVGTLPFPMLQKVTFDKLGFPVAQRYQPIPGILRCKDGHVGLGALTGQHWLDICTLLDAPEFGDKMRECQLRGPEWKEFLAKVQPWFLERGHEEIVSFFQALRVPAAPVGNGKNMLELEHFRARELFVEQPEAGFLRPRSFVRMSATPAKPPRAAPMLGADTERWPSRTTTIAPRKPSAPSSWGGGRANLPFSGLKVLDFTSFWAGPYPMMYLATMGADVIKVESTSRPDGFRFVATFPQIGERWWEWGTVWHATNLGKRDITLDLSSAEGVRLARRLASEADIVAENYSPRVIEQFGLSYEEIQRTNPSAIMLRLPGFGLTGPWRDNVGWALTFEQTAGCAAVGGEPGGPLYPPGGFADPVVGMKTAVALQAALAHREATGEGQLIEIAQVEAVASMTAEQPIHYQLTGELVKRHGRRSPEFAPQGVYASAGTDEWVAVSVRTDDEWRALTALIDRADLAADETLSSLEGRRARHDDIDAAIEEWTSERTNEAAAGACRSVGIPAAALLKTEGIYDEPQLGERGYFQTLDHEVCGPLRYPGWPMRFSFGPEPLFATGAPTLGRDNDDVLKNVLGLSTEEVDELRNASVIGETMKA